MNRRQRRRRERRHKMLDAAMTIIVEQGIDALTIARLANALDAAVGGLYRYFPSKQALLGALQIRAIERLGREFDHLIAHVERSAAVTSVADGPGAVRLACVLTMVMYYMDHAEIAPDRHRLIDAPMSIQAPKLGADQFKAVEEVLSLLLERVTSQFREAVSCGVLDDGDNVQRTHILWGTVHGFDHFRRRDRMLAVTLQSRTLVQMSLRALMGGWGASNAQLDAAFELLDVIRGEEPLALARTIHEEAALVDVSDDPDSPDSVDLHDPVEG